jgi:hypothetical protein
MRSVVLQYGHQNILKLKNIRYKSCSEFQKLQLYYIVQFLIQNACLCRIHSTYDSDTEMSLRQKI